MQLPLGIVINANGAAAIGTLNQLADRLTRLGGAPAQAARLGMRNFGTEANGTLEKLQSGFTQAEGSWYKLGGALGMPLQLTGLLATVTGVNSLKEALIGANSELETSKIRMSAMLKDFNDTDKTADMKGNSVMSQMKQYAMATPFKIGQLVDAGTTLSGLTKDPEAVMQMTKLAAKLAALKGTTDVGWSAQSLLSAMQGNTASLRESFGINVSEDSLQTMSATMGYAPNSPQGRYAVLQRLIDQKAGAGDGIIQKLAQSGVGAASTLQDELTMPFTESATKGYDIGVKALVRFNDAFQKFSETDSFKKLQQMLSDRFVNIADRFAAGLDRVTNGLDEIPKLVEQWGPTVARFAKIGAVIVGVNVAAIALKGTIGASVMVFTSAMRVLSPMVSLISSPLLIAGLLALSAAMWPTAKSLDVGGKSLDNWLTNVEKWSQGKDWAGIFKRPLDAIRKLLSGDYLKEGKVGLSAAFNDAFAPDSLVGRLVNNVAKPMIAGLKNAVMAAFPELGPILKSFGDNWQWLIDKISPYAGVIAKVSLGLGAITVAGRALGIASPLLTLAGTALRAIGASLGVLEAAVASPILIGGLAILSTAMYPLVKNLEVGGKSIDGWLSSFAEKSAAVDWKGMFDGPLKALRTALDDAAGSNWDASAWWASLVAPDSLLGRLGDIIKPVTHGIGQAITENFPALGEFFSHFSNIGETIADVWKTVGNVFFPFIQGFKETALPGLKIMGAALLNILSFAWDGISGVIHWIAWLAGTDAAKGLAHFLGVIVGAPFLALQKFTEGVGQMRGLVAGWWQQMTDLAANVRDRVMGLGTKLYDNFQPFKVLVDSIKQVFVDIFHWVEKLTQPGGLKNFLSGVMDNMPAPLRKLLDWIISQQDKPAEPGSPTVVPPKNLKVPSGLPNLNPVVVPVDPRLPTLPTTPTVAPGFIGPVAPFTPLGNPLVLPDFGGGGAGNDTGAGGNSYDFTGLQVPVTVYAQNGVALDNQALLAMVADSLGPMIAQRIEAAMSGSKIGQ